MAAVRAVRRLTGGPSSTLAAGIGNVTAGKDAVRFARNKVPKYIPMPKACSVIGAPMTYGQPYFGLDHGPDALREHELHEWLKRLDWRVKDRGNLNFKPPQAEDPEYEGLGNCRNPYAVSQACRKIWKATSESAKEGHFVMTLGGDHSIGLGTVAGAITARPDAGIIWVDEGERKIIKKHDIKAFTMYHVDKYGIGKVMEMAMDHLDNRPLHMSYDIDACDPLVAPSTGTTVRGGLTFREAHYVAEAVAATNRLVSLDLVEVNPVLEGHEDEAMSPEAESTVEMALNLISSCMGKVIM